MKSTYIDLGWQMVGGMRVRRARKYNGEEVALNGSQIRRLKSEGRLLRVPESGKDRSEE